MKFFLFLSFSLVSADVMQQTNYYPGSGQTCTDAPYLILGMSGPNSFCMNQSCTAQGGTQPKSYTINCLPDLQIDPSWTGPILVTKQFTTTGDCSGLASFAKVYTADGMCHPDFNGVGFFKANCNNGQPTVTQCLDANCANCTVIKTTNGCLPLGSASQSSMCIGVSSSNQPANSNPSNNPNGNDGNKANSNVSLTKFGLIICSLISFLFMWI